MTTFSNFNNNQYQAKHYREYDSVVKISANGKTGTGVLLYDGAAILTAAHVLYGMPSNQSINISFQKEDAVYNETASEYKIFEEYNSQIVANDIAIIWLDSSIQLKEAIRYDIYRDDNELHSVFTAVGYGKTSTGANGTSYAYTLQKTVIANTWDVMSEGEGKLLLADFDNGLTKNDTIGILFDINHTGVGTMEGCLAPGDSGGPAFLDGKVAGINTAISRNPSSDINTYQDSSFGEFSYFGKVSSYEEWIDKSIRSHYENAPTKASEVIKTFNEGNDYNDNYIAYFLVYYTGIRSENENLLSVEYRTIDGTAKAYEDYIPTSGKLNIYFDESYAVIPVEIVGDSIYEENEVFGLEVYNPNGASFLNNVETLTAYRTIVNDDIFIA